MAYCTRDEFVSRFGQQELEDLLDRDNDESEDQTAFATAQADADSLIDGYVSTKYATPISPIPTLVKQWSANIIRYILWNNNAPEEVRNRYNDTIKALKDVANGVMNLPTGTAETTSDNGVAIEYEDVDRAFTMSTLQEF